LDLALLSENTIGQVQPELAAKAVWFSTPPKDVVKRLATAKVVFIHPDGFDKWTDILLELQQHRPLPVKLFIIADSDYAFDETHIEILLGFFPETHFWIQNWYGNNKRVSLFPLGVNQSLETQRVVKHKSLGISYLTLYRNNTLRESFFQFLRKTPQMEAYYLPKTDYAAYCSNLSECFFTTCPMGEGYDTYRFWESLMVGTIPIVKAHPFYTGLREHYPGIPFVEVETWDDLVDLLPRLTSDYYESLWSKRDLSCLDEQAWRVKIQAILPTSAENTDRNFQLT
jgi:hypothetical protein